MKHGREKKRELEAQKAQDGVMPETNADEKKENLDGDNKNWSPFLYEMNNDNPFSFVR